MSDLDPKQIQPEFATLGYSIRELEARLGLYYCTWFSYFLVTVLSVSEKTCLNYEHTHVTQRPESAPRFAAFSVLPPFSNSRSPSTLGRRLTLANKFRVPRTTAPTDLWQSNYRNRKQWSTGASRPASTDPAQHGEQLRYRHSTCHLLDIKLCYVSSNESVK